MKNKILSPESIEWNPHWFKFYPNTIQYFRQINLTSDFFYQWLLSLVAVIKISKNKYYYVTFNWSVLLVTNFIWNNYVYLKKLLPYEYGTRSMYNAVQQYKATKGSNLTGSFAGYIAKTGPAKTTKQRPSIFPSSPP